MFGDLFSEDHLNGDVDGTKVLSLPAPPEKRAECKLAGIDNQGATCYLNSLLQTLLYTPEFRGQHFY